MSLDSILGRIKDSSPRLLVDKNLFTILKPYIEDNKKLDNLSTEEKTLLLKDLVKKFSLIEFDLKVTEKPQENIKKPISDEVIFKNNLKMLKNIDNIDLVISNLEEDFLLDKNFYRFFENKFTSYLEEEETKDGLIILLKNINNKIVKENIRETLWNFNQNFLFAKKYGKISIKIYTEITNNENLITEFKTLVSCISKEDI